MKEVIIYLFFFMVMRVYADSKPTNIISTKRTGIDKLTFVCEFSMQNWKNVSWLLNNKSIEGYPHFQVTNNYKKNKNILVSTLKVIRPEITRMHDDYTCESDGEKHTFEDIEGILLMSSSKGTGKYFFSRQAHKYKFHVDTVRKICKNWNATFVGRNENRLKDTCLGWECYCTDIKVFDFESAVTEPIKIRPRNQRPLFSLRFNDYVNLDKDFNVTIMFIEKRLIKPTVLKGIRWPTVTITNKFFESNTPYRIKVEWNHPFAKRHKPFWVMRTVNNFWVINSSTLKPEAPKLIQATLTDDGCKIKLKLPSNLDASDTYEYFKPKILVNEIISENVTRISDDVFVVKVNEREENYISAQILSTFAKYDSIMSNSIECV